MSLSCTMLSSDLRPSGNITQLRDIICQCWPRQQSVFCIMSLSIGCSIKGRRKEKDCSPCVIADLHDNGNSYLDDELTQECIVDVDLSALVFRPIGVEYNEWLATHSQLLLLFYFSLCSCKQDRCYQTWKLMGLLKSWNFNELQTVCHWIP